MVPLALYTIFIPMDNVAQPGPPPDGVDVPLGLALFNAHCLTMVKCIQSD